LIKILQISAFWLFSLGTILQAYAQGICSYGTYEPGKFDLSSSSVCLPNIVSVTDQSGGTDIKYIFNYQNQNLEEALSQAQASTTFDYSSIYSRPKTYTIMQIGKKNGKTMVACKSINVKKGNSVVYSYSVCNIATVEINIPDVPINDYDLYKITTTNPFNEIKIFKNDPNRKSVLNLNIFSKFKVEGIYNDISKNCGGNPIEENLPLPNPVGVDYPFNPNIEIVELISPDKARITFSGAYLNETDPNKQYNLFKYIYGSPIGPTEIKDIKPGVYEINLNISNIPYCFLIERKQNACNRIERSAEICTHPINPNSGLIFSPPQRINLSWDRYPNNFLGTIPSPSHIASQEIQKIENKIQKITVPTISATASQYSDNSINCKNEYCYRIVQTISGSSTFLLSAIDNPSPIKFKGKSISNQVCYDASKEKPEPIGDIWIDTEITNQNRVYFDRNNTWPLAKTMFFLAKENNGTFDLIDSSSVSNTKSLFDKTLVNKSESYKVTYRDNCNALSEASPAINSIFLSTDDNKTIQWSNNLPFSQNNIQNYYVIRLDENSLASKDSTSLSSSSISSVPDISIYDTKAPLRISAVSSTNPARYAHSNTIFIPIFQNFALPNIFTPNGDSKNDILEIKSANVNKNLVTFKMEIFDRYGSVIYVLDESNVNWDGSINGTGLTSGIFFYRITGKFKNGEVIKRKGSFEILK
jgi:gliding motility-associated-like protein